MVINPYTFVSLPSEPPERSERIQGHSKQTAGCLDGTFTVTVTCVTPLLLGPLNDDEMGVHKGYPVAAPPRLKPPGLGPDPSSEKGNPFIIPGSSLHGAIRSVHEAMNNSCLRVVDEQYQAVHRLAMTTQVSDDLRLRGTQSNNGSLRMAIVTEEAQGMPTRVQLCGDVIWVRSDQFSSLPKTGDLVDLDSLRFSTKFRDSEGEERSSGKKRLQVGDGSVTIGTGEWVVLVTDTKARPDDPGAVWFACGRKGSGRAHLVGEEARKSFARAIEGSEDIGTKNDAGATEFVPVCKPGSETVVGYRKRWAGKPKDLPVWVKAEWPKGASSRWSADFEVQEVRLSVAWRRHSDGRMGKRIEGWEPCSSPQKLCPSCEVFGSASQLGRAPDTKATQDSYRGHIRIDDARSVIGGAGTIGFRAPLAQPRPTAGQFYLESKSGGFGKVHPLAQWGSALDDTASPRRIRGRKFYWRTQPHKGLAERWRARDHHFEEEPPRKPKEIIEQVQIIHKNSTFEFRVSFENLRQQQIGSLLAAIDPGKVLTAKDAAHPIVTSVGGGRPFGWGAVTMKVNGFMAWSAKARYSSVESREDDASSVTSQDSCVEAYKASLGQPMPSWRKTLFEELAKALTLNAVPDKDVWYPANTSHTRGTPEYDAAFDFWKRTSGIGGKGGGPLTVLPDILEENQGLGGR